MSAAIGRPTPAEVTWRRPPSPRLQVSRSITGSGWTSRRSATWSTRWGRPDRCPDRAGRSLLPGRRVDRDDARPHRRRLAAVRRRAGARVYAVARDDLGLRPVPSPATRHAGRAPARFHTERDAQDALVAGGAPG